MTVVVPPKLIGTAQVADFYGVHPKTVWNGLREGRRPYTDGYVGRVGRRHCWNLNEIIQLAVDTPCQVCGEPGGIIRLCPEHAVEFVHLWDRAHRSQKSLLRFVAVCRWVSERWEHLSFVADINPWAIECAAGCGRESTLDSPLCWSCRAELRADLDLS